MGDESNMALEWLRDDIGKMRDDVTGLREDFGEQFAAHKKEIKIEMSSLKDKLDLSLGIHEKNCPSRKAAINDEKGTKVALRIARKWGPMILAAALGLLGLGAALGGGHVDQATIQKAADTVEKVLK